MRHFGLDVARCRGWPSPLCCRTSVVSRFVVGVPPERVLQVEHTHEKYFSLNRIIREHRTTPICTSAEGCASKVLLLLCLSSWFVLFQHRTDRSYRTGARGSRCENQNQIISVNFRTGVGVIAQGTESSHTCALKTHVRVWTSTAHLRDGSHPCGRVCKY